MVITGLTRNQVALTGSWVRIPPPPPTKKPLLSTKTREVFSCILEKNRAKSSKTGLRSSRSAASQPDFFVFKAKKLVYKALFFAAKKKSEKGQGGWI